MDSATLRTTLLQTENTLPSIQRSAAGMMSHYDRIPSIAVDVWRQCLASCRADQLLPLLYVANEVIQTSKRNRGNKYLEAFSPVLGSSLRLACGRDRSIVEKVRRTGMYSMASSSSPSSNKKGDDRVATRSILIMVNLLS